MRCNLHQRAFTLFEALVASSIVAIMTVGIAVTTEMVFQAESDSRDAAGSVAGAQRVLTALEEDVLFARDAYVVHDGRLAIDVGGSALIYWVHAAGTLTREQGTRSSVLLTNVASLEFREVRTPWAPRRGEEGDRSVATELLNFESFALRAGYSTRASDGGTLVSERTDLRSVAGTKRAGWLFTPRVSRGSSAKIASMQFRGRRNGSDALDVSIYKADPTTRRPVRGGLIARTQIASAQLPTTMDRVLVTFLDSQVLADGVLYFIDVRALRGGNAADIECRTLSDATAAEPMVTEFVTSTDGGSAYRALTTPAAGSQAPLSIEVILAPSTAAVDGETPAPTDATITTAIEVALELSTQHEAKFVRSSFPIQNQLMRARR